MFSGHCQSKRGWHGQQGTSRRSREALFLPSSVDSTGLFLHGYQEQTATGQDQEEQSGRGPVSRPSRPLRNSGIPGTHNLIWVLFQFWTAFLKFECTPDHSLQTVQERLVAQWPTGA